MRALNHFSPWWTQRARKKAESVDDLLSPSMIYVIWEFEVSTEQRQPFESAYVFDGVWAKLFRRDPAYSETILIRDHESVGRYLTLDVWEDETSYRAFKEKFAEEYYAIDHDCEALTESERLIGIFERV